MAPDSLSPVLDSAPRGDARVTVRTADTWVVTVGKHSRLLQKVLWSAETFFNLNIARAMRFLVRLDGVDITRVCRKRHVNAVLSGMFKKLF